MMAYADLHVTRQYRKAKRRFDIAAAKVILLEDLEATYQILLTYADACGRTLTHAGHSP